MNMRRLYPLIGLMLSALWITSCGAVPRELAEKATGFLSGATDATAVPSIDPPGSAGPVSPGLLQAYEGALAEIYDQVNQSVVNIRVTKPFALGDLSGLPELPFNSPDAPGLPDDPAVPQYQYGLGSGFVWDENGILVTNNHVIEGAESIEVTFSDGTSLPAEVIGADPDTDLAVLKVSAPAGLLRPVRLGDSDEVGVGDLAVAIGNPFGLQGTMTTGIVSALGRSIPSSEAVLAGPSFSIPEVIQTDAAINPGNSGGVLLDDQGQVIGVTTAIESPVGANSGVGFAVPSALVARVVPALIEDGHYEHPYLGITGTTLTRELAEAMDLDSNQRGALVREVASGGPADSAGLRGSGSTATIDGVEILVGGDVIVSIDGSVVESMDDLITYLMSETEVGDTVALGVLRGGDETSVEATLTARPESRQVETAEQPQVSEGRPLLGILGVPLTAEISEAMELPAGQEGVLVVQVDPGSPADQAGLNGGSRPAMVDGQTVLVGGDVITAVDGEPVASVEELRAALEEAGAGEEVTLALLRDGEETEAAVVLGMPAEE